MSSPAYLPRWFILVLCVTVLVAQVGGTHLHLCFDGQEPRASVQMGQPGADELNSAHVDQDVAVSGFALIKSFNSAFMLPALLASAVLMFILGIPRRLGFPPQSERFPVPVSPGFHLRPPLRGPPR